MNAYELADFIETGGENIDRKELSMMLRQQADRITELEHMNKNWQLSETMAYNRIAELEKDLAKYDELAIDDLEGKRIIWCDCGDAITQDSGAVCGVCASFRSTKEQSAEPVAWIKKDTLIFLGNYEFGSITIQVQKQKDDEFDIPLYTTPQIKELSDEEIKPLLDRIQKYLECGGLFNPECMEHDKVRDLIMACKAILKKASEK